MSLLDRLVADELRRPVDPRVVALAEAIAERHPGSLAVLFYGSCLRDASLTGMLDFYLIVADYRSAYDRRWLANVNRLLPPNVFPIAQAGLSAKYAMLSLVDLERECGAHARDVATLARMAQPVRLVWRSAELKETLLVQALTKACRTLLGRAYALFRSEHLEQLWRAALQQTYAAELRAERGGRAEQILAAAPEYYKAVAAAWASEGGTAENHDSEEARRWWRRMRRRGRRRHLLRLIKASLTYTGGAEYLAWKVERHSGVAVRLRPWQRRHPILAGLLLLPRLIRHGAVG